MAIFLKKWMKGFFMNQFLDETVLETSRELVPY